jgi:acyl phosphate:glycerol-3-phosphate acyltransferase
VITLLAIIILSYLIGSFPTGFVFGKILKGVDIRTIGSKSIGATNTSRLLGTKIAILVLLIDILKGFIATVIISRINFGDLGISVDWLQMIAGLCAIIGHIFPVWIGFRGGKGVGAGAGMVLGMMPIEILIGFVFFLIVVALTRYISLGSILMAFFILVALIFQSSYLALKIPPSHYAVSIILIIVVLITHRANIKRLISGQENKFGWKSI